MTDLTRLRTVHAADVYKSGRRAATLTKGTDGTVEFRYLPEYLAESERPVATTLPLADAPVRTFGGSLPAFFAGLLPEGHRLSVLRRAVKTGLDDELTLLLAVGTDAPGDVQVIPRGEPLVEVPALVSGESPADLDFTALVEKVDPHALPGVQQKASTSMISTPLAAGFGRFILKLSQDGFPHLVENEAIHLEAARSLEIPVASAQLITDRAGTSGLLVRRFDRIEQEGKWDRITRPWRSLRARRRTARCGGCRLWPAPFHRFPGPQSGTRTAIPPKRIAAAVTSISTVGFQPRSSDANSRRTGGWRHAPSPGCLPARSRPTHP
jgi:serine/threonine-protein kinase HipA